MKKNTFYAFFLSFFLLTFPLTPAFAAHHDVLGASTSDLSVPPTVEGPGFILPDSPFYFLDGLKQQVRLFLAFSPEKKAEVHADVAGERLAELRVMLAKNNQAGAVKALDGIGTNLQQAANDLEDAKLQGKDTSKIAESINTSIKEKQDALDTIESQGGDLLKARVNVTQEALKDAKLGVDASLPGDLMAQELENDINREIETEVNDASQSAQGLERALDVLNKLASEAAQKNQTSREEALKKAIEQKNELLTKQKQSELDTENKTTQKKITISEDEAAAARETVKKAQEAAEQFRKAQAAKEALLRESSTSVTLTPSPRPTETPHSSDTSGESDKTVNSEPSHGGGDK